MSWNKNKLTEMLGIRYPIFQGPMGGGFSTVELLAAVSEGGGLGSLGAYTLTPAQMLDFGKQIQQRTKQPYNINLWVSDVDQQLTEIPSEMIEKVAAIYKPYFDDLEIPMPVLNPHFPSKFEAQVEVVFELKPRVFSFIFGVPKAEILQECRRLGIKTVGAATTLDEALLLEAAGVDALVAAGFEAGGHRPSFLRNARESLTGTFALIQQLKAKIKIPVIAAGGIADGKGIAAAMRLGADGVQLGTAFLACDESNAIPAHREKLFSEASKYTMLSEVMTGRLGRMLVNRIAEKERVAAGILPFPFQNQLMGALKPAALAQGKTDLINFWCGQFATQLKHRKAAELMSSLIEESTTAFGAGFN
jgi:nitronate monooxygenase